MDRVLLVVGGIAIASIVAIVLGRRHDPPASNVHDVPGQLDRSDFNSPDMPWLVAVFTAATCSTCAGVLDAARALVSSEVAVQELEAVRDRVLHDRYAIDAVPTLVIADANGTVQRAFLGPTAATSLWEALAEVRDLNSSD